MEIPIPSLPDLKIPRLPKVAIDWRKALTAAGVVIAVIAAVFIGWTLFENYTYDRDVAGFGSHVAAAEADLARVSEKISAHMRSRPTNPSLAEADAPVREFAAIAEYGRAVTAYHRQVISADAVPDAYLEAQSAYVRALDHLNRAFSLWYSAAAAYDMQAYAAVEDDLARADREWREYVTAIGDYNQRLRVAEEVGEVPPA